MNLSQRRRKKSPGYNFKVQSFQKLSEQKLNFIGVAKKNKQSEHSLFQRINNIQDIYKKNNLQVLKREQSQSRNQDQLQIKSPQNLQQKGRNNSQNQCNQGNNQLVNFGIQKRNSFSSYTLSKTIDKNNSMLSQRQQKNHEKKIINKIQNLDNNQNQVNLDEFEQENESPQESSDYLSFKRKKSYQTIKKSAEMKVESKLQSNMGSQNSSILKNSDLLEQQIQNNSTNLFANKQLKQEYFEQFDNYKNNLNVKKSNSLVKQISDSVEQKRNQKQKKQKEILIFVNQNKKQNQRVYKRIPSENQLLELKGKNQQQHQQQQQSLLQLQKNLIRNKHDTKKTSIILQGNNESEKNNIHNESFQKLKRVEHKYQNLDNSNIEIEQDQIPLEHSNNVINQKNMQDYNYIQDPEQQKSFVIKSQSVHQPKQEKTGIKINGMGQIMNTYSLQSFSIASSPQGQWTNKSRRSSKSSFKQADQFDQIGKNQFIPKNQLRQFPKIPLKQSRINSFHNNGEEENINIEKDEKIQNNTHQKNILAPVFKPGIGTMIQSLFQHQGKNQTKIQKSKQLLEQKQQQNQQMVYSYQVARKKYILPQNIQSLRIIEDKQENLDEDEIKEKTPKSQILLYIEKKKEIFRKQDMELEKQNQIQSEYMKNKKHVEYVKNYESLKYNSLCEFKKEYIDARQTSIENEIQDLMGGKYIQLCENFFQIFMLSLENNQTLIKKKLVEQYASKNLVKEIFDFFNELYVKRFVNNIDQQNIFQKNFKKIIGQYILSPNVYIDNLGGFKKNGEFEAIFFGCQIKILNFQNAGQYNQKHK
ncbi:hypothetical protein PPERSA_11913 [Pseudocohnilembus persalinus]|uniref:Uncharacterized protein n=1 Tax=Pseudocohnilembus persalinus TaxID=266149 RepID=A0A0V0QJV4_PSEPJ|nr:hypothetical protein PPERSA_11913 [Pseudocohnilembus persalinus]|eukprot:KRX02573.1 hypothetical protein PPERSA_11913 [Pseudocohnilembus persalinus]